MNRIDKYGNGFEASSFRPQWRNLLNLISINSTKISPLRVAPVEMTTTLLKSVHGSLSKDLKSSLFGAFRYFVKLSTG